MDELICLEKGRLCLQQWSVQRLLQIAEEVHLWSLAGAKDLSEVDAYTI